MQEFTAPICVSKIHNTTDIGDLFALRRGQWTRVESIEALIHVQTYYSASGLALESSARVNLSWVPYRG
jgi:hypothetical protein